MEKADTGAWRFLLPSLVLAGSLGLSGWLSVHPQAGRQMVLVFPRGLSTTEAAAMTAGAGGRIVAIAGEQHRLIAQSVRPGFLAAVRNFDGWRVFAASLPGGCARRRTDYRD